MNNLSELLDNYRNLVDKVDALCGTIERDHANDITCSKGCSGCCLHFSIFWVEAVNLASAIAQLPKEEAARIRTRAQSAARNDSCPLLFEGACQLYPYRPIICRTHGLPIITGQGKTKSIDFCPRNFQDVETLPGSAVIDLDRLNDALAAINALFVSQYFHGNPLPAERISIFDALFLEVKSCSNADR